MDTLSHATLRAQLTHSAALRITGGDLPMPSHEDRSNMLRLRVLNGEDLTAEEMLYEVNRIREGRRTAEPRAPRATRSATKSKVQPPTENLLDLLDKEMP